MTVDSAQGPQPLRRSPAQHLASECARTGTRATVELRELAFRTHVELRVDAEEEECASRRAGEFLGCGLPGQGRAVGDGRPHVLWCGPGWYLVVDDTATGTGIAAGLRSALGGEYGPVCGSVVDVSAQRTVLELSGPYARDVLAHGCALDLHPRMFGPGRYVQTNLARAHAGLHQVDDAPTYRVLVRASYADYLTRWLLDAMSEYAEPAENSGKTAVTVPDARSPSTVGAPFPAP